MISIYPFLTEDIGQKIWDFLERIKVIVDNDFLFYAIVFVAVVFLILLFRPMKQSQSNETRKRPRLLFIILFIVIILIVGLFVYLKFFR